MSPRPYRLGKREEAIGQGRRRILDAAREQLRVADAYPGFTVDAVARRADVARATVYYQFGSKTGLLEAICDDLAEAGGVADLARVFTNPSPDAAIRDFITAFARFWAADRVVMRRLRALAALDPDVGAVIAARDQWRREGLTVLAGRLPAGTRPAADQAVQILYSLTSFETFDTLAGPDHDLADALPAVTRLAETVLSSGLRLLLPVPGVAGRSSGIPGPLRSATSTRTMPPRTSSRARGRLRGPCPWPVAVRGKPTVPHTAPWPRFPSVDPATHRSIA